MPFLNLVSPGEGHRGHHIRFPGRTHSGRFKTEHESSPAPLEQFKQSKSQSPQAQSPGALKKPVKVKSGESVALQQKGQEGLSVKFSESEKKEEAAKKAVKKQVDQHLRNISDKECAVATVIDSKLFLKRFLSEKIGQNDWHDYVPEHTLTSLGNLFLDDGDPGMAEKCYRAAVQFGDENSVSEEVPWFKAALRGLATFEERAKWFEKFSSGKFVVNEASIKAFNLMKISYRSESWSNDFDTPSLLRAGKIFLASPLPGAREIGKMILEEAYHRANMALSIAKAQDKEGPKWAKEVEKEWVKYLKEEEELEVEREMKRDFESFKVEEFTPSFFLEAATDTPEGIKVFDTIVKAYSEGDLDAEDTIVQLSMSSKWPGIKQKATSIISQIGELQDLNDAFLENAPGSGQQLIKLAKSGDPVAANILVRIHNQIKDKDPVVKSLSRENVELVKKHFAVHK